MTEDHKTRKYSTKKTRKSLSTQTTRNVSKKVGIRRTKNYIRHKNQFHLSPEIKIQLLHISLKIFHIRERTCNYQ